MTQNSSSLTHTVMKKINQSIDIALPVVPEMLSLVCVFILENTNQSTSLLS